MLGLQNQKLQRVQYHLWTIPVMSHWRALWRKKKRTWYIVGVPLERKAMSFKSSTPLWTKNWLTHVQPRTLSATILTLSLSNSHAQTLQASILTMVCCQGGWPRSLCLCSFQWWHFCSICTREGEQMMSQRKQYTLQFQEMPISQSPESMMKSHNPRCCPIWKSPWPPFIPQCNFMRRQGKPTWRTKDHPRLCVMKLLSRWAGSVLPLETELQPLWEQGTRRPRPSLATPLPEHCKSPHSSIQAEQKTFCCWAFLVLNNLCIPC